MKPRKLLLSFVVFLIFSCNQADDSSPSMFLYFPESKQSLLKNGYKQDSFGFFYKRVNDTTESIQAVNLKNGQFTKSFFVRYNDKDSTSMLDLIANRADSLLFRQHACLLIKHKGGLYLVLQGHNGSKSSYRLHYFNIKLHSDKLLAVDVLRQRLQWYSDAKIQSQIKYALTIIYPQWRLLPDDLDFNTNEVREEIEPDSTKE